MSRLRDAIDALDLAGWLSQYASDTKSGGGGELRLRDCPMCGDDRHKLYVNTEKKRWICYVCDWGRGLADVVQLMSAVSGRSMLEVRLELMRTVVPAPSGDLASALHDIFERDIVDTQETRPLVPVPVPGAASFDGLTTQRVLQYALNRGLSYDMVRYLELRAAGALLIQRQRPKPVKIPGPFLVFPVRVAGVPVSWQGRRIVPSPIPYVSADNIKDWLWPLDQIFFDHYTDRRVVLVEGVFDALGMWSLRIPALCTFGKSISDSQLRILHDLQPEEVTFAWDLDAYREMERAVSRVAYQFPVTRVASMRYDGTTKRDAGDALQTPELGEWVRGCLTHAMDVKSPEFFQWRMENLT